MSIITSQTGYIGVDRTGWSVLTRTDEAYWTVERNHSLFRLICSKEL